MTKRRILSVDDEPNILSALKRQLRREYDVITAGSGSEGLEVFQSEGPFAVVMSDYNMPRMDGVEFLRRIRELSSDTVSIMLTGRAELDVAVSALHHGKIFRFLNKPVSHEVLLRALDDSFEQHRLITAERELTRQINQANAELQQLNLQLEGKVAERTRTLKRLYEFVSTLNGLESVAAVANLTVNTTSKILLSPLVSLWGFDAEKGQLQALGATDPNIPGTTLESAQCLAGSVLAKRGIQVFADPDEVGLNAEDRTHLLDFPILAVPLLTGSEPVGIMMLSGTSRAPFTEEAIATANSIADSASIALRGRQHHQERDETQDAVIMALAKLSEYRDPETGQHLNRLKVYCRLLCEALRSHPVLGPQITQAFIEDVVRSSPLHDIGKVGIPDHILKKPGRHTEEEFELMKTHASIGGDTLRSVLEECRYQGFIRTGMDIAYCHHERWDGTGYPKGLSGAEIPLAARVLALADVYDALTTARVYKPAFPHEKARQIIIEGSGSHFDPSIVDAFLSREHDFATTAQALADNSHCLM